MCPKKQSNDTDMPKTKLREDQHIEFKSSFTDAVIESLTAFANSGVAGCSSVWMIMASQ